MKNYRRLIILIFFVLVMILFVNFINYTSVEKTIFSGKYKSFLSATADTNSFTLILKDQSGNGISNGKFYIKELIAVDGTDEYEESNPVDIYGNELGTEESVNGETVKTFTTDSNGEVILNLREGKYKVVQLTTDLGFSLNETNEYTIDVKAIRGAIQDVIVEEPTYSKDYDDCYSVSTKYAAEGRNDGYALYYYESEYYGGKLSLVDDNNDIVDTIDTDQIHQIVATENAWYCLVEQWRTGYYYIEKVVDTNGTLSVEGIVYGIGYYSDVTFTVDEASNNIFVAYSSPTKSNNFPNAIIIDIYSISSNAKLGTLNINGNGKNYVNSIAVNDEGIYLSAYIYSDYLYTSDSKNIQIDNPYCILKISSDLLSLEKVKAFATYASSGQDDVRRVHKVVSTDNGDIYYIGTFEDTLTFSADTIESGEEIILKSNGETDGLVIKLDSNLLIKWAVNVGGIGIDNFYDAGVTSDGGIIIGGDSDYGEITFDVDETQAKKIIQTSPIGGKAEKWRGVSVKLNSIGEAVWAYEFGYQPNEGMYGLAVINENSFALCGFTSDTGVTTGRPTILRLNEYTVDIENKETTYLNVVNQKDKEPSTGTTNNDNNISSTETTTSNNNNIADTVGDLPNSQTTSSDATLDNQTTNSNVSNEVSTGDRILQFTIPTILIVILLNIIQIRKSKTKKRVCRIGKNLNKK